MDWEDVLAKRVAPPFKPYISDDMDVGNFSEEFTNLAPMDSPAQPPAKHTEVFRVGNIYIYVYMSYVARTTDMVLVFVHVMHH